MLHATGVAEGAGGEGAPFGEEFHAAVRAELEAMLQAPIFAQSNRCKRFLTYIVEQTLSGIASELKERTIGIAVFERANDYHTGDDSIVRVTANEVRKRLGQFYGESASVHQIHIELPRGSYVPEFRIQPLRQSKTINGIASSESKEGDRVLTASSISEPARSATSVDFDTTAHQDQIADVEPQTRIKVHKRIIYSVVFVLLVVCAAVFWIWKENAAKRLPDLWSSFLHAGVPILVSIDTHNLQSSSPQETGNGQRFVDLVLRRQIISLDDAAILASMASELGKKGIAFRVVGAEQTSLADLRRQPVILIGAIDNKWTLRLTEDLRYRIEVANPPGSGSSKQPIASIIDAQNSSSPTWTTDLSLPFAAWKNDYAIIARFDDATTGVPVLIEAGLGNPGTVAASELISSNGLSGYLKNDGSCQGKKNFEAVIETQIIDTKSGPPHVLRLTCW